MLGRKDKLAFDFVPPSMKFEHAIVVHHRKPQQLEGVMPEGGTHGLAAFACRLIARLDKPGLLSSGILFGFQSLIGQAALRSVVNAACGSTQDFIDCACPFGQTKTFIREKPVPTFPGHALNTEMPDDRASQSQACFA